MKATRPFRPLILIIIGAVLALTTGALILVARPRAEPAPQPVPPVATSTISTTSEPVAPSGAATPSPTLATTPTRPPTIAATPTDAPTAPPTSTPTRLPTPIPARAVEVEGWQRIQIDDAGIGLQVPQNWERLADTWAWSPDGSADLSIGLIWVEPGENWSPGTMLPPGADTYETKPINLGWSSGTSYLTEVGGGLATLERHVVIQVDDSLAVDFYARGATTAELAALETILDEILTSIIVNAYAGDPVDVSVQFLAALLSNEETISYLSSRLREVVAGGRPALSLLGVENLYASFSVSLISAADGRMTVQADLDYGAGRVEERLIILVQEDGAWRIDEIEIAG
jgi:hypothetical protein